MNSESLINAIFANDNNLAADALNGALASKIADALEVKKVEIASNFISTPTEVVADVAPAEAPAEVATAPVEA